MIIHYALSLLNFQCMGITDHNQIAVASSNQIGTQLYETEYWFRYT